LSPDAAALATFWQSAESALRLLGSSAGLVLIALSHACFAAAATLEFAAPPPELLELVELPELLGVLVAGVLADDVLGAAVLELLLPQPATSAPPTARTATAENSLLAIGLLLDLTTSSAVTAVPRRDGYPHAISEHNPSCRNACSSLRLGSDRSHLDSRTVACRRP
jgi:hypothetical protein